MVFFKRKLKNGFAVSGSVHAKPKVSNFKSKAGKYGRRAAAVALGAALASTPAGISTLKAIRVKQESVRRVEAAQKKFVNLEKFTPNSVYYSLVRVGAKLPVPFLRAVSNRQRALLVDFSRTNPVLVTKHIAKAAEVVHIDSRAKKNLDDIPVGNRPWLGPNDIINANLALLVRSKDGGDSVLKLAAGEIEKGKKFRYFWEFARKAGNIPIDQSIGGGAQLYGDTLRKLAANKLEMGVVRSAFWSGVTNDVKKYARFWEGCSAKERKELDLFFGKVSRLPNELITPVNPVQTE